MEMMEMMPESSPLSVMPPRALYPEAVYELPAPVMGLGGNKVQRRFISLASSTNDAITIAPGGGQRVIQFRIPQGGSRVTDFRDLTFRGSVRVVTGDPAHTFAPTIGFMGGLISEIRIRSATDLLYQLTNYNRCYSAMSAFFSSDQYTQMQALDAVGAAIAGDGTSQFYSCPLMCPLSVSSQCWPTFAGSGDLIIEIVTVSSPESYGAQDLATDAQITYTNMELIYSEIQLGQDLYTQLIAEYAAKKTLYFKSLDFVSNQAAVATGATSVKFDLNHPRTKTALFWFTTAAATTENPINRMPAAEGSVQIYKDGRPLFGRALSFAAADPADLMRPAACAFKEVDDVYRGSRLNNVGFGAATSTTQANANNGPVYVVDFEKINGNEVLSMNSTRISDGLSLTWTTATGGAYTLYGLYVTESGIIFEADGYNIRREYL